MSTSYDSYLGLTKEQTLPNSQTITYDYSSQGTKLRRTTNLPTSQTTHYIGAFEYEQIGTASPTLSMIHLPGGRAIPNANGVKYEYYLTDHLGNVRMVFDNNNGEARIIQQSHYYPFGMTQTLYDNASQNKYLYNGKELEATNLYDFGARQIPHDDPRFRQNDPLAEYYYFQSPYVYGANNPVRFRDINGMGPGDFYDEKGKHIGKDGNEKDKSKYVVTDKKEVKKVNETDKNGGTTQAGDVSSAKKLPSDVSLKESLNVLSRTDKSTSKDNVGGLHGESSLVLKDGTVIEGPSGDKAFINANNELQADENLPTLPNGKTNADVETSIHSHVTETLLKDGHVYSHDATDPSNVDIGTFKSFDTNIIVGPLGKSTASTYRSSTGEITTTTYQPKIGIVIYSNQYSQPLQLTIKAVQNILK